MQGYAKQPKTFTALFLALLGIIGVLAVSGVARAGDAGPFAAEAGAVLQRLRAEMMREMQSAMTKGPAEAISVCRHLAPEISRKLEQETGWHIRRIGLKVRNPDNRANASERGLLMGFEIKNLAGQPIELLHSLRVDRKDGNVEIHFMQAVPMLDGCTACHGEAIDPETAAAIQRLYPEDEAVGYKVGDIRGAFSLYKTVSARAFETAQAAPPRNDLEFIGYTPTDRPNAKGSATEGLTVFKARCQSCHGPRDLAAHLFSKDDEQADAAFCRKLETHGYTEEKSDCDILAFLKDLALFLKDKGIR
jgi:cytochrome c553